MNKKDLRGTEDKIKSGAVSNSYSEETYLKNNIACSNKWIREMSSKEWKQLSRCKWCCRMRARTPMKTPRCRSRKWSSSRHQKAAWLSWTSCWLKEIVHSKAPLTYWCSSYRFIIFMVTPITLHLKSLLRINFGSFSLTTLSNYSFSSICAAAFSSNTLIRRPTPK